MEIDRELSIIYYLKSINKKISYITFKMAIIRQKRNLKLNNNLFKTFIEPLYRLGFTLYAQASKRDKNSF